MSVNGQWEKVQKKKTEGTNCGLKMLVENCKITRVDRTHTEGF